MLTEIIFQISERYPVLFWILVLLHIPFLLFLIYPFIIILIKSFSLNEKLNADGKEKSVGCIITVYKNFEISKSCIDSLLKQRYSNFKIYLVADACDDVTSFNDARIKILSPPKELKSKAKSIKYALDHFDEDHEISIIFDPDNLASKDFLAEITKIFNVGFKAAQGRRTAKNLDTIFACVDAISEMFGNLFGREIPFALGSSAASAGSGFAVETHLLEGFLSGRNMVSRFNRGEVILAEDKDLQHFIVSRGYRIAYAKDALLFDEKVVKAHQVKRQRSRWIKSYFQNIKRSMDLLFYGLLKMSKNRFIFGLVNLYPPIFLLVLISGFLLILDLLFSYELFFITFLALLVFTLSFFLMLKFQNAPKEVWSALWGIPLFVFYQVLALLHIKRTSKDFMATRHVRHLSIDDLQKE